MMTAAWRRDRFAAIPDHDEIAAMAPAAIYSCLSKGHRYRSGYWRRAGGHGRDRAGSGVDFAVMATAMLAEACGGTAEARKLAAAWTRRIAARDARTVMSWLATPRRADYSSISTSYWACVSRVGSGCAWASRSRRASNSTRASRSAWSAAIRSATSAAWASSSSSRDTWWSEPSIRLADGRGVVLLCGLRLRWPSLVRGGSGLV